MTASYVKPVSGLYSCVKGRKLDFMTQIFSYKPTFIPPLQLLFLLFSLFHPRTSPPASVFSTIHVFIALI